MRAAVVIAAPSLFNIHRTRFIRSLKALVNERRRCGCSDYYTYRALWLFPPEAEEGCSGSWLRTWTRRQLPLYAHNPSCTPGTNLSVPPIRIWACSYEQCKLEARAELRAESCELQGKALALEINLNLNPSPLVLLTALTALYLRIVPGARGWKRSAPSLSLVS